MRMTNHVRGHNSFEGSDVDMKSNKVRKARVIYLHLCHVMYVMSGNQLSQWSIFVFRYVCQEPVSIRKSVRFAKQPRLSR